MISAIYSQVFAALKQKPGELWGISLLSLFLACLSGIGFVGILAVGVVISLLLEAAMEHIYLRGFHGEEVKCVQLFESFRRENIGRVAGGMSWRWLWLLLWSLIPFAGPVLAIIKGYSYRFTPYILMTQPEVGALEALERSKAETKGYKGKLFLSEFIIVGGCGFALLVLLLLSRIYVIGPLFSMLGVCFAVLSCMFLPLVLGLLRAAFYEEIQKCNADPAYRARYFPAAPSQKAEASVEKTVYCPNCGTGLSASAVYCSNCGTKLDSE